MEELLTRIEKIENGIGELQVSVGKLFESYSKLIKRYEDMSIGQERFGNYINKHIYDINERIDIIDGVLGLESSEE